MVTIYDVAAVSGFSPATVSKVFNSYPGINKKTYEKIMAAANEIGYVPSGVARALSTRKSWLVGMLFSEELFTGIKHPHFSEIFSNAQIQLGKAGYDVVFINNSLGGEKVSYYDHCRYRGVEGVFLAASEQFRHEVQCIVENDIKMVSVEAPYHQKYSVISENYQGAIRAMEYLYALGHRKIAYISGPMNSLAAPERYKGYTQFLASKKIKLDHKLVVEASDYTAAAGYEVALQLINSVHAFTAVFAGYDDFACAAMNCFRAHGLRVPEDISVMGFDDLSHAEIAGLTTIRQDRERIGCTAADVLISQMQGIALDLPYDIRIPTSLVERSSCRRIGAW